MGRIYIAGPMRGIPFYNFKAFDDVKEVLVIQGWDVVSPADLDRDVGVDALKLPSDTDWNSIPQGFDFAACRKRDIEALESCDAIYMLMGWRESKGARAEHAYAQWAGMKILGDVRNSDTKLTNPKDAIGVMKAKFSTVPAGVIFEIGLAMLEGACKYGRHNYRHAGVRASVYYDAAMGHTADWWEGQDVDPDSGFSHITKALASLTVLRDAMLQGKLEDDRPPRSKVFKSDFNKEAKRIIEQHKDKTPRHYTIADSEKDNA